MSVYVDDARIPARIGKISGRWSHLTADTREELHTFAARIGLRRSWYQICTSPLCPDPDQCPHWHYDVTESMRQAAVAAGARQIHLRQWPALIAARRAQLERAA